MKRRDFMISSTVALAGGITSVGAFAAGGAHVDYTPEAFAKAKASGNPVLLDFYASW